MKASSSRFYTVFPRQASQFWPCLTVAWLLALTSAPAALAYSYAEPAVPPEVLFSRDLRQRVVVPGKVNVNRADMNELLSLPGMNENIALKIMRVRPLKNREDFMKMPFISPRNVQQLLQQIENKIEF
jgi:DNA uptake protein ComE-like DNA-binding protein